MGEGATDVGAPTAAAVSRVDGLVSSTFEVVSAVRAQVLSSCEEGVLHEDRVRRLEPRLRRLLSTSRPRLDGLGFVAAPEAASGRSWLEWVRREGDAVVHLEPDLDPDSVTFYDVTEAEWFRRPRARHAPAVVGPYVDVAGTDQYVVTLTLPVVSAGTFLGVAGADLRLGDVADAVLPALRAMPCEAALVNADRRVIVTTTSRWPAGSILPPAGAAETCRAAPWSVVVVAA